MAKARKRSKKKVATREESPPEPKGMNTTGLPVFPDELLLEILSYYPPPPLPNFALGLTDMALAQARREVLFGLSLTCSNLRRFFRPHVWQRIEVYRGMMLNGIRVSGASNSESRQLNLELVRQLEIVTIRDPSLAQGINVINVDIMEYCLDNVLAELARCLGLFPNLHTVKLSVNYRVRSRGDQPAQKAFNNFEYPQIKNLLLDPTTFPLILSCKQACSIHSNWRWWSHHDRYLQYAADSTTLEDVGFQFEIFNTGGRHHIFEHPPDVCLFPNLRVVTCAMMNLHGPIDDDPAAKELLEAVSRVPKLRTLKAVLLHDNVGARRDCPNNKVVLGRLKTILRKIQNVDHEDKILMYSVRAEDFSGWMIKEKVIQLPFLRETLAD